ncbi:translation initiation factor IF-2 [Sphingomonas sp. CGMCC 1.13654]|uniref:Translation initiation factor IF-2 n=1 Tax=Sphingomonas chungangi TaxID=2683589 RepID=A0A838L611_9SPHN|nr:translation initiation factor IF-2 [Sphingomonas chungangi]MBA2934781.1 translation initiation factor IF-2 [Sphingomonas chungangi]MVW58092.1 translation initiation factor IF-2 [Sphingomonas chungangi]
MSDSEKPKLGMRAPLGLKRTVETGKVKQSFSHGRSNTVIVETKRSRVLRRPGDPEPQSTPAAAPVPEPEVQKAAAPAAPAPRPAAPAPRPQAAALQRPMTPLERREQQERLLREAEEARMAANEENRRREERMRAEASEEEKRRAEENKRAEEERAKQAEADAQRAAEETTKAAEESPAAPAAAAQAEEAQPEARSSAGTPPPRRFTPVARPEPPARPARTAAGRPGGDDRRQSGKLTVTRALDDEGGARARSLAALKRAREKDKRHHQQGGPQVKQVREVVVPETITVAELANRMAERGADLVKALFKMGMPVTLTQTIDQDTAELLVTEFGHTLKRVSESDIDIVASHDADPEDTLQPRAPVVTIMGHVDHGKTSLLDALRGTDVVRGEAGGITQHIGAYQVQVKSGDRITFLDTPGHEAFSEMRGRGANITDIVVVVVAADDGIRPQTIEAINHTKAAGVPMIVAINKVDKPGGNPQKVREALLQYDVQVEEMGGDVQDVEVSALAKTGLDELIEKILLQAELLELKANPDREAEGTVVEAQLDKGRGPVATILVRKGTLRVGDIFVVGAESGKVRALIDDKGKNIKEAGPSMPVEVLGLSGVPGAGDPLTVVENEARAREVAAYRAGVIQAKRTTQAPASLESMFSQLREKQAQQYPVVVKADTQGSVEAIVGSLNKISTDLIQVRILHSGVGGITESDVTLAAASRAPIIGFNVRANAKAREIATRDQVALKYYDVIYDLLDEIRAAMAGQLGPEAIEHVVGRAEIREVFSAGKHGRAAGLLVVEGFIRKALRARITREDVIIYNGSIASLRRFKDDVPEVRAGLECGVTFESHTDIKPGDFLETFEVEMRERTL